MTPEDVLLSVIEKLEKNEIVYMITGSFASNLHGVPRTTFDADIVISANFEKVSKLIEEIGDEFYADLEMARDALSTTGMFNIVHLSTGFKIDFIFKKKGQYYDMEFKRRKPYKLKEKICFFVSPEDTILSKLLWAKKSESEKQFQDALGVARVQRRNLDEEYLRSSAKLLNVSDLMERLLEELKKGE